MKINTFSRFFLLLAFIILCTGLLTASNASDIQWAWADRAGGTGGDNSYAIAVDARGNSFITGYFYGSAYFGDTQLVSSGETDIFIAMLDAGGNFMWAVKAGGESWDCSHGIAVDPAGNSYITGYFLGTAYFGDIELISVGGSDLFVAMLDPDGNFLWAERAGGGSNTAGLGIALDSAGNIHITGYFQGTAYFGGVPLMATGLGDKNAFITELDPEGNFIWARQIGASIYSSGAGITVDTEGNSYITGYFNMTADFGDIHLESDVDDVFITMLDTSGNFLWAEKAGGGSNDQGTGIEVDSEGNLYITGFFYGTAYFGDTQLISAGGNDIFIAKLDNEGSFLWAEKAGGTGDDSGNGIDADSEGNLYITGQFISEGNFGDTALISTGGSDIFISSLDSEGNFVWARRAGGTGDDAGYAVAVDNRNLPHITGLFHGTADFSDIQLVSQGNDVFISWMGYPESAVISLKSSLAAGVWIWEWSDTFGSKASIWKRISDQLNVIKIMTGDITGDGIDEIVIHFSDEGLFYYSIEGNTWTKIAGTEDCIIDFCIPFTGYKGQKEIAASIGDTLSIYRDNSWLPILLNKAECVEAMNFDRDSNGIDELLFSSEAYGGLCIFDFNSGMISKICNASASQIISGDMTGDGHQELAAVFDGYGTYLIRYLPDKAEIIKSGHIRYELFDLAKDIGDNSRWISKSRDSRGLQFNRLTWGTPDAGHLIAMGNITHGLGMELFLVYQGRTYYYSNDDTAWSTFLYVPLKRIIAGTFSSRVMDDLIVCDSTTGNIWLGKTSFSSWELLVGSNDTDAMGVME